jgi:N-acetylmuramoyl-L-alanine amidase
VPVVFRAEQHGDDIHLVAVNPRYVYERIVIIDPGHGGSDTGAVVGDIRESDIVLAISMQIYDIFAQSNSGIRAYLTRNDDSFVFNALRSNIANTMGDMLVSVHTNAYPHSQAVAGTEVLFHPAGLLQAHGAAGRFYLSNREFSQIMQDGLVAELGTRDRGIIERTDLLLLNTSQVPTAFLEIDFKTNPAALANLTNADYQQRIAQAVYEGIVRGFNTAVRVE